MKFLQPGRLTEGKSHHPVPRGLQAVPHTCNVLCCARSLRGRLTASPKETCRGDVCKRWPLSRCRPVPRLFSHKTLTSLVEAKWGLWWLYSCNAGKRRISWDQNPKVKHLALESTFQRINLGFFPLRWSQKRAIYYACRAKNLRL